MKISDARNEKTIVADMKAKDDCDHNEMVWRIDRWECAKCGYIYGYNRKKGTC